MHYGVEPLTKTLAAQTVRTASSLRSGGSLSVARSYFTTVLGIKYTTACRTVFEILLASDDDMLLNKHFGQKEGRIVLIKWMFPWQHKGIAPRVRLCVSWKHFQA